MIYSVINWRGNQQTVIGMQTGSKSSQTVLPHLQLQ